MKPGEWVIIYTPGDMDETDQRKHMGQRKLHARDQWRRTESIWNYQAAQESV